MKLTEICIHNYRSVRDLTLKMQGFMVIVGPNNHGKSNILHAIEFALTPSSKPDISDFCDYATGESERGQIWVDLTFSDLMDAERDRLARYVNDGSFRVRKTAEAGTNGIEVKYNGYVPSPADWWLTDSAWERLDGRGEDETKSLNVPQLAALIPSGGIVDKKRLKELQERYIADHRGELEFKEELESAPFLGSKSLPNGSLPAFFLVPAVLDLNEETKTKKTSTFGRLLQRASREMSEDDVLFNQLKDILTRFDKQINSRDEGNNLPLAGLEREITEELGAWGAQVEIRVKVPDPQQLLDQGTELWIDDGFPSLPEKKGHGLQRAVLFALVRAWTKTLRRPDQSQVTRRMPSESTIFCIEEPELYLHPHAQRQLYQDLRALGSAPDHQVIVCSHSTHFISLEDYRSIAIVSKVNDAGTVVRQCTNDLFEGAHEEKNRFRMAHWINPDRGELFFARRVILVEGETERVVLPFVAESLGCYDTSVSVIDCGGKNNLPLYIKILNAFSLQYFVIYDEDRNQTNELNAKLRRMVEPALGQCKAVEPDFEGLLDIPESNRVQKGKALAALNRVQTMLQIGAPDQLPQQLIDLVKLVYSK